MAAFVTRLRPSRLPSHAARQLPDQSTTIWVEPTSTGVTRLRGALRKFRLVAASALVLALGAGSTFALSSGERLNQGTNSVSSYGSSASSAYGALRGYTSISLPDADNGAQYTALPSTKHGR